MRKPAVLIFDDLESLSRVAAERFSMLAREAVAARGRFLVALSGGSTPKKLYALLADLPYLEKVPWEQTFFFWGDERCVPPDHEGSNYYQARRSFLERVPAPAENVYRIRGELPPQEAAHEYAQRLRQCARPSGGLWPRFDLVLLGMGADGHTASLFPGPITGAELTAPALAVTAHYEGRPAHRVSLTPVVFNAARQIMFLVSGETKAAALFDALNAPDDPERVPTQRIRPLAGQTTWFVDREAAERLA